MAVVSNTVVLITLKDGKKITSDERVGMNLDEIDIKGCLEAEGRINVYHTGGGFTIVSERDVSSIETIHETVNWRKHFDWIDSNNDEPSDFFMRSISSDLSFSQINDFYVHGFYLRDINTGENISYETVPSYFRYVKEEKVADSL